MEQILIHELPRYLSLHDRNTLCSLNKKFYRKLRPITPSWEEVEQKKKVEHDLVQITQFIFICLHSPFLQSKHLQLKKLREVHRSRFSQDDVLSPNDMITYLDRNGAKFGYLIHRSSGY